MNVIKFKKSDLLYVAYTVDNKPPTMRFIFICFKTSQNDTVNLEYYTKESFEKSIEILDEHLKVEGDCFITLEYKI